MTLTAFVDELDGLIESAARLADAASGLRDTAGREGLTGRLQDSVIRPLRNALSALDSSFVSRTARADDIAASEELPDQRSVDEAVWDLAQRATNLTRDNDMPLDIREATAALQDLAVTSAPEPAVAAARLASLRELQAVLPSAIVPLANGPLLVTNVERMTNWLGESVPVTPMLALCRCGLSAIKPLCDGSHAAGGFSDTKDPKRTPDRLDTYTGQQITVTDNRGTCAHSGFCTDRLAGVFHTDSEPFVTPSGGRMDEIIRAVRSCPSGALGFALSALDRSQADQSREPAIEVSRDGPYRVTGGIALLDPGGSAVSRNAGASLEHYSLCRCGQSRNKPFCSGMHWYVDFVDPRPSSHPTLFEWAGGLPALTRMTRLFYERFVPEDPLLGPLFASITPGQAERVAAWFAEVLGGPADYTAAHGGHQAMAARHAQTAITEEQRARFVELMCRAADTAGLPNDPPFRAALSAYLEWQSRVLAGARPGVSASAVPRWEWSPAGPPATAPQSAASGAGEASSAVTLPPPGAPVTFVDHVKQLFRGKDRSSMLFAFDLWSYADVTANATDILERVRQGSMPCDGAWQPEWIGVLERWIAGGMLEAATSGAAPPPAPPPSVTAPDGGPEMIQGALGRALQLRSSTPVKERELVIEHREPLIYMLCAAAELEHALMCEYLFAAFSLKRSVDEGLTEEQLAVVERWRAAILLVAKQEMLHLAINCNLVTSLGASPHLSRPNLPQPAKHYPPGVRLALLPFGEQALRHFIYLERPEGMDIDDAEGLEAVDRAVPLMGAEEIAPHLQEFQTVGHLYRSIEAGFRHLAEKLGEDRLFLGPAPAQASGDLFGWKELRPIASCEDAVAGIEAIVAQGEGARGDWRNAHFGRFLSVLNEYLDMMDANPGLEVARPVVPVLVRPPETGEDVPLITDPVTARVADIFNVGYEVLLQLLYRLMCHVDESDEQIGTLADVSVGIMFDVIEPLADVLTTMPVGPEFPGRTAGPTFELFYQPDYLLPHRRAAWLLMAEHLKDAAVLCDGECSRDARFIAITEALRKYAATLDAGAT